MAVTGTQLETRARVLSDEVNSDRISAAVWLAWQNEAIQELHGLIAAAFADTFYSTVDFALTNASNVYTLPATFMRLKGLDIDPTTTNRRNVPKFNFAQRNGAGRTGIRLSGIDDKAYRVVSRTTLIIEPKEACAGNYRLYYTAIPTLLTALSESLQGELEPWAEYIPIVMAIKALASEESNVRDLVMRRDTMRADIEASAMTDENEADSIVDLDDAGGPFWP